MGVSTSEQGARQMNELGVNTPSWAPKRKELNTHRLIIVMVRLRLGVPTKQASSDTPSGASGRKPGCGNMRKSPAKFVATKPSFCSRIWQKSRNYASCTKVDWVILSSPRGPLASVVLPVLQAGLQLPPCGTLENHESPQHHNIPSGKAIQSWECFICFDAQRLYFESSKGSVW